MKPQQLEPIPEHTGLGIEIWDDMRTASMLAADAHAWIEQARWLEQHSQRAADLLRQAATHARIASDDLNRKSRRAFEAAGVEWPTGPRLVTQQP